MKGTSMHRTQIWIFLVHPVAIAKPLILTLKVEKVVILNKLKSEWDMAPRSQSWILWILQMSRFISSLLDSEGTHLLYPKGRTGSDATDGCVHSPRQAGASGTASSPYLWKRGLGAILWGPCFACPSPLGKRERVWRLLQASIHPNSNWSRFIHHEDP